jgi:hypothetical protein
MNESTNESKPPMTLYQLMLALQKARQESALGDNAVVCMCIEGIPYIATVKVTVDNDDSGGSVILLHPQHEPEMICSRCEDKDLLER